MTKGKPVLKAVNTIKTKVLTAFVTSFVENFKLYFTQATYKHYISQLSFL